MRCSQAQCRNCIHIVLEPERDAGYCTNVTAYDENIFSFNHGKNGRYYPVWGRSFNGIRGNCPCFCITNARMPPLSITEQEAIEVIKK